MTDNMIPMCLPCYIDNIKREISEKKYIFSYIYPIKAGISSLIKVSVAMDTPSLLELCSIHKLLHL